MPSLDISADRLSLKTSRTCRCASSLGLHWPLVVLIILTFVGVNFPVGSCAAERLNVLWIIAEDYSPDLGIDGVPELRTPNMDRLIKEGMRFRNAFATGPVCSISRSAFMTGMYQTTIGAHNHRSHRRDNHPLPNGVRLVSDWLRDEGYFTANVVHLPGESEKRFFRGTGKTDWNFTYEGEPFDSNRWRDLESHQPFYAQINFKQTHRSWNAAHKHIAHPADPAQVKLPPYYPDDPRVREDWAQYLNSIMALDRKVGRVLDLLESSGLADNTVVFFFSDHGRAMPRGKQWCYDTGLKVPLVIRWPSGVAPPSQYEAGTETDQIVELIDVTATTLAIAGVPTPELMQGRVFLGEQADPPRHFAHAARDRCDGTVFHIRSVRNGRYRYICNYDFQRPFLLLNRYKETQYPTIAVMRSLGLQGKLTPEQARLVAPDPRPREELYDLKNDPYETVNLADRDHAEILATMRTEADEWMKSCRDTAADEDPETVRYWIGRMKKSYHEEMDQLREKYPDVYPLDRVFRNETWLGTTKE